MGIRYATEFDSTRLRPLDSGPLFRVVNDPFSWDGTVESLRRDLFTTCSLDVVHVIRDTGATAEHAGNATRQQHGALADALW